MASSKRTRESLPKKVRQKNKPVPTLNPSPGQPEAEPLASLDLDPTLESHAAQLSTPNTSTRQRLASHLGRTGGNQYLQRVISQVNQKNTARPTRVQRHTSTPLEYEVNSIQAKHVEGYIQRHTSTPLEYEVNSIQAKLLPGAVIQRNLVDDLNEAMDGWGTDEKAITEAINNASEPEKQEALRDPRLIARLQDELSRSEALEAITNLGASLSLRLEVAMNGFWPDSAEILKMIESVPASRAAEKDAVLRSPVLMNKLNSILSREDALTALKGLGAPLAERLRTAMRGWGVDEAAIEKMIKEASQPEKQAAVRDRALIDMLKDQVSQAKIQQILKELGVSLVDRLNAVLDGWSVDPAAVIELSSNATDPEKAQVLADSATIARLSRDLNMADALTVMSNLGVSLADRLHVAMTGWGADSDAILSMIPQASQPEREAVYADTATMSRLENELSAENFRQVSLLLRFGSQEAIDAATEEELNNPKTPENLTALLSAQLDSDATDTAKMASDIAAASNTDREMVRQNHSLLKRMADAVTEAEMRQMMELLGGSIVDRLNLLLLQNAAAADIITLATNASPDDKQLVLNNRALLDRLLEYLEDPDDRALMAALGDTLTNQLNHALDEGQDETAICNLITAAPEAARAEVEVDTTLMNRLGGAFAPIPYWRVRLHLKYGQPSAYPAGLTGLITAWDGDSSYDNLRRTLANLDTPTFNGIKDVVGLRDLLRQLVSEDEQYTFLLRMLDQGLIVGEETVTGTYSESLLQGSPALTFTPTTYTGTQGFDVAYYRDRVQVDVRIRLEPLDDTSKANKDDIANRWEAMIEGAWSNVYSLQNTNHTLPIKINCNFTTGNAHHTVNLRTNANPSSPAYNAGNWYDDNATNATWWYEQAPIHEFGHLLGNPDEYNLSQTDYQNTVGTDPTTDGIATSATDSAGTSRYTNPSVMGSTGTYAAGSIEKRHLNYFTNWINRNRRRNADGTFAEPAFTIV